MPQQINKKILLYLFLFIILGTFNNKKLNKFDFPEINSIQIDGLETDNGNFLKKVESLNLGNIFFLKNILLTELFDSNNIIEEYKIFKKYPSSLEVKVIETKFLALTKINQKTFFVGSNGKLIEVKENLKKLPFIFGELDINKFLSLKKIIDETNKKDKYNLVIKFNFCFLLKIKFINKTPAQTINKRALVYLVEFSENGFGYSIPKR